MVRRSQDALVDDVHIVELIETIGVLIIPLRTVMGQAYRSSQQQNSAMRQKITQIGCLTPVFTYGKRRCLRAKCPQSHLSCVWMMSQSLFS